MTPSTHNLPPARTRNSWRYEFSFWRLGAGYLAGLVSARFVARKGSATGPVGLDLSLGTGLTVGDTERGDQTYPDTLLEIEPDQPLALEPGRYRYALRLEWADRAHDVVEGWWDITDSPVPALAPETEEDEEP